MTALTIHIGMNKTGTTALQRACFNNQPILAQAGLLYPKTGLGSRSIGRGLHYRLSEAFLPGGQKGPELVSKLRREVQNSGAKHALVSSEFFVELRDLGPLQDSLKDCDVRILVYLRRHDHWVSSLFSQGVKSRADPPWGPSVEQYIRHIRRNIAHYYVYSRLLDRWSNAFGKDAIDVRIYSGQDVITELFAGFGIDATSLAGLSLPAARANSAPSRRQLAAIDHIQRSPYPDHIRHTLVRRILAKEDPDRERQLMTTETARALLEEHAQDYEQIARDYLGRADGILFAEDPPEPGGPERIALSPREGIAVMTELLSETV